MKQLPGIPESCVLNQTAAWLPLRLHIFPSDVVVHIQDSSLQDAGDARDIGPCDQ